MEFLSSQWSYMCVPFLNSVFFGDGKYVKGLRDFFLTLHVFPLTPPQNLCRSAPLLATGGLISHLSQGMGKWVLRGTN